MSKNSLKRLVTSFIQKQETHVLEEEGKQTNMGMGKKQLKGVK
jgi:hypothetical protein